MRLNIKKRLNNKGFTIIEVMIVVAIAGLIMVILFIAVPQAQKSQRDTYRRHYVGLLMHSNEEFLKNNSKFPSCVDNCSVQNQIEALRFLTKYMPPGTDPSTGAAYNPSSAAPYEGAQVCDRSVYGSNNPLPPGVSSPDRMIVYCFDDASVHHNPILQVGQIVMGTGHYCYESNPDGNNTVLAGPHFDFGRVYIVIGIEKGGYYCLDNFAADE
jgi:prepilin-type N-terminal cleavage/methylation domain-containing protein